MHEKKQEKKKISLFPRRKARPALKKLRNYAFIDSQNLNLGVQRVGFKMNWKKFREYLRDDFDVENAYMFIGYMPENEDLYTQMQEAGYLVALKPTLDMFLDPNEEKKEDRPPTKGNVDAELVMYTMKEMGNYDKAIIVSGDGDFYSLIEYMRDKNKLLKIMTPNWRYSTLLKPFEEYVIRLDLQKRRLAYRSHHSKNSKDNGNNKGGDDNGTKPSGASTKPSRPKKRSQKRRGGQRKRS